MDDKFEAISRFSSMITAAGLTLLALSGCGSSDTGAAPGTKNTYVLVHGAFADSSAWDKVKPLLENEGDEVITLDLPAHGKDTTPVADATLQAYTDRVVKAIDGASRPVILVGHSMGGTVVSQAAEARPDKVKKIVYLAAFLLEDQKKMGDVLSADKESKLGGYLSPSSDGSTFAAKEGWVEAAFCQDCSAEDAAAIRAHFNNAEPTAPFSTPIHVTNDKWGKIPRFYIETTQDRALGPATQKSFYATFHCEKVTLIATSHCPFLTKPAELADALKAL